MKNVDLALNLLMNPDVIDVLRSIPVEKLEDDSTKIICRTILSSAEILVERLAEVAPAVSQIQLLSTPPRPAFGTRVYSIDVPVYHSLTMELPLAEK